MVDALTATPLWALPTEIVDVTVLVATLITDTELLFSLINS